MIFNNKLIYSEFLYNFFIVLSLIIFFFSTTKVFGKSFNIDEVSSPDILITATPDNPGPDDRAKIVITYYTYNKYKNKVRMR